MLEIIKNKNIIQEYLTDESRYQGNADSISFARSEADIIETVNLMNKEKIQITIQGARTGISGGAVPEEGHILNFSRMQKILGITEQETLCLNIQPGLILADLRQAIEQKKFDTSSWDDESITCLEKIRQGAFFFPPDPTETSASLGGMVSCNASGACSYFYGPTRKYIQGLKIIIADGS